MSAIPIARFRHLGLLWFFGAAAIAAATWACFTLHIGFEAASFIFLILIVLLSLLDSLISSIVFSVIAVVSLDYFFMPPLYTLFIFSAQDYGTLATFVTASIVITSLVRRSRRIGAAKAEQATLLDLTHDAVVARNLIDEITYWNRGAEELYGWKAGEVVGKISHNLLQTIFPAPLEEISRELSTAGHWEGELIHIKRDGSKVKVSSRWSLQKDEEGRRLGTLETNNDITERRRAEELLRRSQAIYLAQAQKLSGTGSFAWNSASGDHVWSSETYRIFGYDPTVRPSMELALQRVHPDDLQIVRQAMDISMKDCREIDLEHRLMMSDGEIRHVHIVAQPLAEEPDLIVGAVMDITARTRAQETLQRVQADFAHVARVSVLGEMTASIAHEVSQPLSAIRSDTEASLIWLDRAEPDIGEARASIAHIAQSAARAADVIARVRGMAARRTPDPAEVSINKLIEEAVAFLGHQLRNNDVTVSLDLDQNIPPVLADVTQLQQVVVNLAMNAIQAMTQTDSAPRQLTVRSRQQNGTVTVTLDDTGPGISAENLHRIFESFFTTKEGGMGLGLRICKSIIESCGGRIGAENRADRGARITFSLPVAPN